MDDESNKRCFVQALCTAGVLLGYSMAQAAISTGLEGCYKLNENSGTALGTTTLSRDWVGYLDEIGVWVAQARTEEEIALVHGLSYFAQVELNDTAMDDVLAVFNAANGSALAGGYTWGYVTGLASTTKGQIGGTVGGGDAWIALDANGNGVQLIPEPASVMLLAAGVSMVLSRRRK